MNIDKEKFNRVKANAEDFYKTIEEVYCPYFKEKVAFNSKGLDHVKLRQWNKARPVKEQYMRLKLMKLAPQVIGESHTLQEFYETKRFERQRINKRWEKRMVGVRYYGFVAITSDLRVKVKIIVKEIEGGKKFFWSIIPFWRTKRSNINNKYKKILRNGDLEIQ